MSNFIIRRLVISVFIVFLLSIATFSLLRVSLTPAELGVLELLMRSGDTGVSPDAIAEAAGAGADSESIDPDAVLTQLRRKTRLPGKTRRVRKERVMLYYFDDDRQT